MSYIASNISVCEQPTEFPITLGSSSANRQHVLSLAGWKFEVLVPDIDEKAYRNDDPYQLPAIIAKAKATAILGRLSGNCEPFILLTADQVVLFQDEVREKPIDEKQAAYFLTSYSNQEVHTISAVVATHYPSGRQSLEVVKASVRFGCISPDIVQKVIERGMIYSSAGGFRIEDEDLNPLIECITGSVDSVLGMPLEITLRLIKSVAKDD